MRISNEGGRLSQAEIDQMIKDAEANAEADKQHAETVAARNGLEGYAYSTRNSLTSCEGKLSADDKQAIQAAVQATLDWLDSNPGAQKEQFQAQQTQLEGVVNPIMTKMYQGAGDGFPGAAGPEQQEGSANMKVEDVD